MLFSPPPISASFIPSLSHHVTCASPHRIHLLCLIVCRTACAYAVCMHQDKCWNKRQKKGFDWSIVLCAHVHCSTFVVNNRPVSCKLLSAVQIIFLHWQTSYPSPSHQSDVRNTPRITLDGAYLGWRKVQVYDNQNAIETRTNMAPSFVYGRQRIEVAAFCISLSWVKMAIFETNEKNGDERR